MINIKKIYIHLSFITLYFCAPFIGTSQEYSKTIYNYIPGSCTIFFISHKESAFFGNNEDWKNPFTKVWYEPAEDGKYGRVHFGFDNFQPQGGMNEKGLCFDGFATTPKKVLKSLNKPNYKGNNFLDTIMAQCATVEEVLKEFDKYNLHFMERAMFFYADATGDAAIIEGDQIIRKEGRYQIVTNFYQSEVKDRKIPCDRYKIADAMLNDADRVSVDLCKRVLAATHAEGQYPTVYSNIYDLKNRVVYLYHFHNFQNVVKIDLAEELKKGARRMDLPALFPRIYIAEVFMNRKVNELEAQKAKYTHKVKTKILDSYVGQYKVTIENGDDVIVTITRAGDKLFGQKQDKDEIELHAVSNTEFMHVGLDENVKITFVKDKAGKVNKMIVEVEGQTYTAERIE